MEALWSAPLWPFLGAATVVVFAATTQTVTGFGFSIVAVPLLAVLLGVREAVIVNLVLSMIANLGVTVRVRRHWSGHLVRPMVAGGMLGLVPGMVLFYTADVSVLHVGIAALVTLTAVMLLSGVPLRLPDRVSSSVGTGVLSGVLAGAVGLGGPPLTVYLSGLRLQMTTYRATMSVYFTVLNLVLVPTHILLSQRFELVVWSLLLLPAVAVGHWLGELAFSRMNEQMFRRMVALIVLGSGVGTFIVQQI